MWSIIGIIENNGEHRYEVYWKEWQDILLGEFKRRITALDAKGYRLIPARNTFSAIFLQVKGFPASIAEILPETIKIVRQKDSRLSPLPEYDGIAMAGHRIGMLGNSSGLKEYLQGMRASLKPEWQILLTTVDSGATGEPESLMNQSLGGLEFQQANLIGPFFAMFRIKTDTLKSQAAAASWQCEIVYRQDESNYLARLSFSESG